MPGVVCVLVMIERFEVSMRSRMLPDSMRVGSFTIFCNPNSLIISSSLLCLLAVLVFVVCWLCQSMSGRLKSPAITMSRTVIFAVDFVINVFRTITAWIVYIGSMYTHIHIHAHSCEDQKRKRHFFAALRPMQNTYPPSLMISAILFR